MTRGEERSDLDAAVARAERAEAQTTAMHDVLACVAGDTGIALYAEMAVLREVEIAARALVRLHYADEQAAAVIVADALSKLDALRGAQ